MDTTSYSRRSLHPTGRILTGQIVRLMDGYPREVRVGQPVLVVVLAAVAACTALT
jgi:hypothetical protein